MRHASIRPIAAFTLAAVAVTSSAHMAAARTSDGGGEKQLFRISATNGYLVGGEGQTGDSMRYQGRKIWSGPSQATVIVDERRNTGLVIGTVVTHGHTYTVIMNRFSGHKPFMSGGIAKDITLHGLSGRGGAILPKVDAYLAGWGKGCVVYKDDDILYDDFRCHFMLTEEVRDPGSHRVPNFPKVERVRELIQAQRGGDDERDIKETKRAIRQARGGDDLGGMQLHLIAHSSKKNPKHVPPYETAMHFMWDDVRVSASPVRLTRGRDRETQSTGRRDDAIKAAIEDSLRRDMIREENVDVSVQNGTVTLNGTVRSRELKQQAAQYAAETPGVRRVRNNLEVQPTSAFRAPRIPDSERARDRGSRMSPYDRELKDDIEGELTWSPFVDADSIRVRVRNGVATLSGTVEDREGMKDAIENAYEAGAVHVINQLTIRGADTG